MQGHARGRDNKAPGKERRVSLSHPSASRGLLATVLCVHGVATLRTGPRLAAVQPRDLIASPGVRYGPVRTRQPILAELESMLPDVSFEKCRALLSLGAVYYRPPGRECLTRVASTMWPIGNVQDDELHSTVVEVGGDLRVHTEPVRYAACTSMSLGSWVQRIVHIDDNYVIVDKPPGVPSAPHVSNGREWLVPFVAAAIAQFDPRGSSALRRSNAMDSAPSLLRVCHRLDAASSGLITLARTGAAAERYRKMLQDGAVSKRYRALICTSLTIGPVLENWISGPVFGKPAPRIVAAADAEVQHSSHAWQRAVAKVVSCSAEASGWELRLELGTGRTHQLRAQLAAAGCPILFDGLYKPLAGFLWHSSADDEQASRLVAEGAACTPSMAIALQSCEVAFDAITVHAPDPWWHPQ